MVGRDVESKSSGRENALANESDIVMDIKNLWVNMAGELVDDVTLSIRRGEFLGIGGLAGQGKLGLPNGIMGLAEAGGTITYNGKPFTLNSPKTALDLKLAFVSEDRRGFGLLLDEPIYWNVTFPAMQVLNKYLKNYIGVKLRDEKAMRNTALKYIESLEVRCVNEKQKVRELSGGNQQKICLARAFDLEPEMLFVSEPTRGIDIGAKSLVLQALKRYNEENDVTIVMVSSELEELRSICDRIAIINEGKVAGILSSGEDPEKFGLLMAGLNAEKEGGR
jgi:simple sugar transport system ATP-binding protein